MIMIIMINLTVFYLLIVLACLLLLSVSCPKSWKVIPPRMLSHPLIPYITQMLQIPTVDEHICIIIIILLYATHETQKHLSTSK